MRRAESYADIPTSQTHRTHTKHNKADRDGNKGIDYEFDGGKQIQEHPNGHSWDKSPHFNNHPATKKHYKYKRTS